MPFAPGRTLTMGRPQPAWLLAALGEGRLLWLDAGNGFDAYGMSRYFRAAGHDPKEVLSRVDLARPFNLYQLETMVRVKVPLLWRGQPVVVADPMPLFYEEDVPAADARRVLDAVIKGMRALPAAWLILARERPAPAGREGWLERLAGP